MLEMLFKSGNSKFRLNLISYNLLNKDKIFNDVLTGNEINDSRILIAKFKHMDKLKSDINKWITKHQKNKYDLREGYLEPIIKFNDWLQTVNHFQSIIVEPIKIERRKTKNYKMNFGEKDD